MSSRCLLIVAIASLSSAGACYEYVPVNSPEATVGKVVELKITDPGRVGLANRFGPGLDRVEGRLVADSENQLTVSVTNTTTLEGANTKWAGESVNLDRGFIGTVSSRRISPVKTALLAVATGTVLYFTAGKALTGGGKDPDDPPEPINPPLSRRIPTRIPIGIRIRALP
jgi:hypothetical protein